VRSGSRSARLRLRNVPLPEAHLFGVAALVGMHRWRQWRLPGTRPVHRLLGWSLIAAGTYLVARSLEAAGQVNLAHPNRAVMSGPYAISRNPMYVGWALLHLGAGVAGGSGWIVATAPAAAAFVHREILREERELCQDLGEQYERYRQSVPRYLPALAQRKPGMWRPARRGSSCGRPGRRRRGTRNGSGR
jgi:protein-S-isoprenylcysteine O-methyltransferase Ste14